MCCVTHVWQIHENLKRWVTDNVTLVRSVTWPLVAQHCTSIFCRVGNFSGRT